MSVDPFIQGSGSQSTNQYSYVMNNPLSLKDPSGYNAEGVEDKMTIVITGALRDGDNGCCGEGGDDNNSSEGGCATCESNGTGDSPSTPTPVGNSEIGSQKIIITNGPSGPNTENSKVTNTRKYKDGREREYLTSST